MQVKQPLDSITQHIGLHEFTARGNQFTINGITIFLRGKHDGVVFTITAHPPMDTASWLKIYKTAQKYGINHYRFHSWCPP